jgi:hypothetical protein
VPLTLRILTAVAGLAVLGFILELLRRRQLQEKYAILWLVVGIVTVPVAIFPELINLTARAIGIASGVSLIMFLGVMFLLLFCVHLSWEVSRLEEETRTLAEEIALIRTEREAAGDQR